MSEWQPIETAPDSRLFTAWMEGYEQHSGMDIQWTRNGYALMAMREGKPDKFLLDHAVTRIVGADDFRGSCFLEPTHWMPLPEPPK